MPSWFDYICKEPLSHHRSRQTWVLEGHRLTQHSHLFGLFIQTNEYQKLESPALAKYLNVWSIFSVPLFLFCMVVTCGLFYPFYIVHSSRVKNEFPAPSHWPGTNKEVGNICWTNEWNKTSRTQPKECNFCKWSRSQFSTSPSLLVSQQAVELLWGQQASRGSAWRRHEQDWHPAISQQGAEWSYGYSPRGLSLAPLTQQRLPESECFWLQGLRKYLVQLLFVDMEKLGPREEGPCPSSHG